MQKMLNLWAKKRTKRKGRKMKLLNEFVNETQSPLNLEASEEKRKGEMGKVGFEENEYGERRITITVFEKKRERK